MMCQFMSQELEQEISIYKLLCNEPIAQQQPPCKLKSDKKIFFFSRVVIAFPSLFVTKFQYRGGWVAP